MKQHYTIWEPHNTHLSGSIEVEVTFKLMFACESHKRVKRMKKTKILHRLFCSCCPRYRVSRVSAAVTGIKSGIWIWTLIVINNLFHNGHIHNP